MKEGNRYCNLRLKYDNDHDLAAKLRSVADSIEGDRDRIVNKPKWLRIVTFNWGGDGP